MYECSASAGVMNEKTGEDAVCKLPLLAYFVSAGVWLGQGCSPKKKCGTPETRLRQRFLNNLGLHTCCTEIILHCVSVSN